MYLLADSMNCLMVYAWYSITAVLAGGDMMTKKANHGVFWTDSVIKRLLSVLNYRQ